MGPLERKQIAERAPAVLLKQENYQDALNTINWATNASGKALLTRSEELLAKEAREELSKNIWNDTYFF